MVTDELSPRRRLLEEVLEERSRVVALMPPDYAEEAASSFLWPLGLSRIAGRAMAFRSIGRRRAVALDVAVVALAWLERIDAEMGR